MGPDNGSLSYHKLHGSNNNKKKKKQRILPLFPRSHSPELAARHRWASPGHGTAPGLAEGEVEALHLPAHSIPFTFSLSPQSTFPLLHSFLGFFFCTTTLVLQPVLTVPRIGEKQLLVQKQEGFSFFCSPRKRPFRSLLILPVSRLGAFRI